MADPGAVDLGAAFALPPEEAVQYFRSKGYAISWNWRDTWQEANDRAFTVAKMARYRLLSQTRQIVDDMLAKGMSVEMAAKEMEGAFRSAGWWGRQAVTNADGQTQMVQLGSMHRIRTILRTNMGVAYNAGRRRRQAELADERPFWRYVAIRDARTRPSHLELHGTTLRHDDPAWEAIYPPNGFNCRCRVRAITERQAERNGQAPGRGGAVADVEDVDPDTGEITPLRRATWTGPDGAHSFTPDPGWGYLPGSLPPPSQSATVATGQATWRDLDLPDARDLPRAPAPPALPKAPSRHAAAVAVEQALGLSDERPSRLVETPTGPVLLSQKWALHITRSAITPASATPTASGRRLRIRTRFG
ncbi:MAG: phage minor head protein [Gammaproteobacteria bacterium]|nr:phage minor head protein [Gammaproteobacteria bacterium]